MTSVLKLTPPSHYGIFVGDAATLTAQIAVTVASVGVFVSSFAIIATHVTIRVTRVTIFVDRLSRCTAQVAIDVAIIAISVRCRSYLATHVAVLITHVVIRMVPAVVTNVLASITGGIADFGIGMSQGRTGRFSTFCTGFGSGTGGVFPSMA